MATDGQSSLDAANAAFWDELCGTSLARSVGVTDLEPASLARFDGAYLAFYPYLAPYVLREPLAGKRVLEIGLGYGTLGQLIASRGADYHGIDIAPGPVSTMRLRLERLGLDDLDGRVRQGSALELPFADASFDYVYSIGCLHHTGDLPRAVAEVHRVLRPGGRAVLMLYNDRSLLHLALPLARRLPGRFRGASTDSIRAAYDSGSDGSAAPHTDFTSREGVRRLLGRFSRIRIQTRNFPAVGRGPLQIPRWLLLRSVGRIVGTDLYITADK